MKMRSPIVAMLWEIWRVTRAEAAWKLALGTGAAMIVMALSASQREIVRDSAAAIALILIVLAELTFRSIRVHREGSLSTTALRSPAPASGSRATSMIFRATCGSVEISAMR